jgi:hypothetical protein
MNDDESSMYTYRDVNVQVDNRSISKEIDDAKKELESSYSTRTQKNVELDKWKIETIEWGKKIRLHLHFKVIENNDEEPIPNKLFNDK